jgi:hypothetical protein
MQENMHTVRTVNLALLPRQCISPSLCIFSTQSTKKGNFPNEDDRVEESAYESVNVLYVV